MISIPLSFHLSGRTWTVEYHDILDNDPDTYGDCRADECVIRLKRGMKPELVQHTFYHELAHAFCETLAWEKLNADEGKIDALSSVLLQFLSSKRGRLQ